MLGGTFFSQYYGPATMSGNTEITSVRANRGTYSNVIKVQWDVRQVGTDPTRFEVFRRLLGSENPEDYQSVHVTGIMGSVLLITFEVSVLHIVLDSLCTSIGSIVFKCEGKDTNLFSNIQIFNAEK